MISNHSIEILILVTVVVIQQLQIRSVNKRIDILFEAHNMMCDVNQKQLETIKQVVEYVQTQSETAQKIFEELLNVAKKHNEENM